MSPPRAARTHGCDAAWDPWAIDLPVVQGGPRSLQKPLRIKGLESPRPLPRSGNPSPDACRGERKKTSRRRGIDAGTCSGCATKARSLRANIVRLVSGDRGSHFFELLVRFGTDRADGGQANDDDQGQHHSVLDCGRAIFFLQELNDAVSELFHFSISYVRSLRNRRHPLLT